MNGPHDMGGMHGYGPVMPEPDEPLFHGDWEKKALALTVAMGFSGAWNIDISRHARESLPPAFYTSKSYYQIWLAGLEKLMLERGMVTRDELESGKQGVAPVALKRVVAACDVPAVLAKGGPVEREPDMLAAFSVGERVRTVNINPSSHTRLPRYARNREGVIEIVHGCHVFPDSNAKGEGESPQWLYAVSFEASELFGPDGETNSSVTLDCWESYLERV